MQSTDRAHATHAMAFHGLVGSFLAAEGFALRGDIGIAGRFGGSTAAYRSERGLSLTITFEPQDGNAGWMSFGREWSSGGQLLYLSNSYSSLARRFGWELPSHYMLGKGEQQGMVVKQMAADLKHSLPTIVSAVSLSDLVAVENDGPSGAAVIAARTFGANYSEFVDVSSFQGKKGKEEAHA